MQGFVSHNCRGGCADLCAGVCLCLGVWGGGVRSVSAAYSGKLRVQRQPCHTLLPLLLLLLLSCLVSAGPGCQVLA
jgi:hypothetical protein